MQVKVLRIVSTGYVAGGAENGIVKVNPYLVAKDYEIRVLASDLGADQAHFSDYAFQNINTAGPLKPLYFLFNPFAFRALKKLLKEYQPDIVHLHTMHQLTPSVLFLLKKYPTVMTLHGPETFLRHLVLWCLKPSNFIHHRYERADLNLVGKLTYFYFNTLQKSVYRRVLRNVDVFIAPSRYIQQTTSVDVSPVVHIPNFIELRTFQEVTNHLNVLFVGRLEKTKGVEYLLQALVEVLKVYPQTTLTVIGDGTNRGALQDLAQQLHVEAAVQFPGWIKNTDLDRYYQYASVIVVPSTWPEAFGNVIPEAMSVGRPVIATRVGGIPEIIEDGVDGYLVEPNNAAQIADRVMHLFAQEELLGQLGGNARQKAESFSIERYVDNLDKVYKKLLKR